MTARAETGRGAPRASQSGRSGFGPLLLVLPAAFAAGFALRALNQPPPDGFGGEALSDREAAGVPDVRAGAAFEGYEGEADLGTSSLVARLAPLEPVPEAQAFVAASWGMRLGLGEGEPWRLDLRLGAAASELELVDLRIEDADGIALRVPVLVADTKDPRAALLRSREGPLAPGSQRELVLWGRPPGADARMVFGADTGEGRAQLQLDPTRFSPGDLPRWLAAPSTVAWKETPTNSSPGSEDLDEAAGGISTSSSDAENPGPSGAEQAEQKSAEDRDDSSVQVDDPSADSPGGEVAQLQARVDELTAEVERLRQRRIERELAWYQYNRALAALDIDAIVAAFAVDEVALREEGFLSDEVAVDDGSELDRRTEREQTIERGVRSLLALEGFSGLDLLELGPTHDQGGAGPAVFRMLDDRGRLLGSLNAQTLRLEASRAARTITLVLEDGFESRGGNRTPFTNGSRRLLIPYVDPQPWIDALPELFPPGDLSALVDDGKWQLESVRREMNRLFALETSSGWWRLHGLGGVLGAVLRDVQLEQLGEDGRVQRRIFADRLRVLMDDPGLLLVLEDGAIVRGENKTPFVEGSYRLFLPRAPLEEWRAARLPGTVAAEEEAAGEPEGETAERPRDEVREPAAIAKDGAAQPPTR